jgi:hypothetical protein
MSAVSTLHVGAVTIHHLGAVPILHVNAVPTSHMGVVPIRYVDAFQTLHVDAVSTLHVGALPTFHWEQFPNSTLVPSRYSTWGAVPKFQVDQSTNSTRNQSPHYFPLIPHVTSPQYLTCEQCPRSTRMDLSVKELYSIKCMKLTAGISHDKHCIQSYPPLLRMCTIIKSFYYPIIRPHYTLN